jgi:sphingolipid delta-4 desaturase
MSAAGTQAPEFLTTHEPQPHRGRARRILAHHPEIKALSGRDPATALWTLLLVAIQLAAAAGLAIADVPWWAYLLAAYGFGAFVNHALFVLIHEYTHNLVFRSDDANRLWSILANVPIVFPAAIGFRNFHLLHHRYLGMPGLDPDIPGPREARWVGRSRWRKALWVGMFWFVQGVMRPNQVAIQQAVVPWSVFNGIAMAAAMAPLAWFAGWEAVAYLFLSTIFALGLHPVGARWFQEHYVFAPGQETYSYYGPLNRLCFNMGYHNEHHDFPAVPWSRLPAVRAAAPEAYDGLMHHNSWTRLLARIVLDRSFTPHDRIVRPARRDQRGISAQ